ncbi:MAG TPA: PDZ domain-containing protein, partial [Gemmatales bacterium]|nr:PDZ domain-containing protein [Gemmatales bacterium]
DHVVIAKVLPKSPAEKAGLKPGDIIRTIDNSEITKVDDVYTKLRNKSSSSKVKLLIERNGEEIEIQSTMSVGPKTFINPTPDMLEFLKKYGYKRADGVWEYQETDETKDEFKRLQEAAKKRSEIFKAENRPNEEIKKNAPSLVTALNTLINPVNSSIVAIYNGREDVPGEYSEKSNILGTIISEDGYILTKASELKKDFYVRVTSKDKDEELDGKLIAQNSEFDIALIKVEPKKLKLTPVKWASQSEPTIGSLLVSPTLENKPEKRAAISIVSNAVREIKNTFLMANKAVLGVQFSMTSEDPILEQVTKNGPADKAGIKPGDRVLTLNGKEISNRAQMQNMLQPMKPGDKVTLEIKRLEADKQEVTKKIVVTLGSRADVFSNTQLGGPSDFRSRMFETAAQVSKRKEDFPEALTHDAALGAKNMGGPLLNLAGEAIGINIARFDRTGTYAITYSTLKPVIEKMLAEARQPD